MGTFDSFKDEWLGRRCGDPLLIGHGESADTIYQCVSLIKQYMLEVAGIRVDWPGNAIDFAYHTNQTILTRFAKHTDGSVEKGDIVVLHTPGYTDDTQPGHIGIATGNGDPNSVEILEQNGLGSGTGLGRDAIGTRMIPRNRIACTLRYIPVALPLLHFDVQPIARKTIALITADNLYGFDFTSTADMDTHPLGQYPKGYQETVTAIATRSDGTEYYLVEPTSRSGFNRANCQDYVAPIPYTPPAAPLPIPKVEYYDLVTTVMTFKDSESATYKQNAQGTIDAGTYIVLESTASAKHLIKKNTDKTSYWIHTSDNVKPAKAVEPIPEPVVEAAPQITPVVITPVVEAEAQDTPIMLTNEVKDKPKPNYYWIDERNHFPVRLRSTNSIPIPIHDLDRDHADQQLPPHWEGDYSMWAEVNGITYFLPDKTRKSGWMYGVSEDMVTEIKPRLDINRNGISDTAEIGVNWDKFVDIIPRWVSKTAPVIIPKVSQTTTKIGKTIDGFVAKRKVK